MLELFYRHGMPKNEELAKAVQNSPTLQNGAIIPATSSASTDSLHRKQQGQRLNQRGTDAGNNDLTKSDGIENSLEKLTVKEAEGQRSEDEPSHETEETDSYYVSPADLTI